MICWMHMEMILVLWSPLISCGNLRPKSSNTVLKSFVSCSNSKTKLDLFTPHGLDFTKIIWLKGWYTFLQNFKNRMSSTCKKWNFVHSRFGPFNSRHSHERENIFVIFTVFGNLVALPPSQMDIFQQDFWGDDFAGGGGVTKYRRPKMVNITRPLKILVPCDTFFVIFRPLFETCVILKLVILGPFWLYCRALRYPPKWPIKAWKGRSPSIF